MSENNQSDLKNFLNSQSSEFSYAEHFCEIILGDSSISASGFPVISEKSYLLFLERIPHLFQSGHKLLKLISNTRSFLNENHDDLTSVKRVLDVLERVTFTASITSPSDLWLMRQVIASLDSLNISREILKRKWINLDSICSELGIQYNQLKIDLDFLHSRGLLEKKKSDYKLSRSIESIEVFEKLHKISKSYPRNMIPVITNYLNGENQDDELIRDFFTLGTYPPSTSWVPGVLEIEIGFRLLPLVLSIRGLELNNKIQNGVMIECLDLKFSSEMKFLLRQAGIIANGQVTKLGERVFSRGPGPYGIIHAYHSYMTYHESLLTGKQVDFWVARGENVAASQDANASSFKKINDSIDQFCKDHNFDINIFIEHAVGQGEATRQRYNRSGSEHIKYFGADLENAAIDKAIEGQAKGLLPVEMKFIRNADIGDPDILINGLKKEIGTIDKAIMVVGNGFHEIRNQTNEKMINVFKKYCESGLLLVFTEESGLLDEDLLFTGWNTYHAGFRYVHEISGQGLRPAIDSENEESSRFSWRKCAILGGYDVLENYTTRTRTIYPHPRENGYNPSISVNYFCVPKKSKS